MKDPSALGPFAFSSLVLVVFAVACSSSTTPAPSAPPDSGIIKAPSGTTPCEALASCCRSGSVKGTDTASCAGPFDAGSAGQSFCQGNFDALRREGFCAAYSYEGFVPYTLGKPPSSVTAEPTACAAIEACCVSNEVWGDAAMNCQGFASGSTNQAPCQTAFNTLRQGGYCGGFSFDGAVPLGSGDAGPLGGDGGP